MVVLTKKEKLASHHPEFEANIVDISHEGRGIAEINGKKTFIFGALPGEKIKFHYRVVKKNYDEGIATEIMSLSDDRVTPHCPHFGTCGGCQLQHLDSRAQIQLKQSTVLSQLKHIAHTVPKTVLSPIIGPLKGYRRKARLGVKYVTKKQKVLIGFRELNSPFITELSQCDNLYPLVSRLIPDLQSLISRLESYQFIPQIEVSVGYDDNEVALIFRHLKSLSQLDLDLLTQFASSHKINLFLQPKGPESIYCLWPSNEKVFLRYRLEQQNLIFDFHPSSFTQINHEINQLAVNEAIKLLNPKPNELILDLFCGIGNFSLPLAQYASQVVGVEGSAQAVINAKHNAQLNSISNVEFYLQDLSLQPDNQWSFLNFDSVLLDPPRTGAYNLMQWLALKKPKQILYISCKSATMARDAAYLIAHGYQLDKVGVMDMFPHTAHVESIALFKLKSAK